MAQLSRSKDIGIIPQWIVQTGIATDDDSVLSVLQDLPTGCVIYDAYVDVGTIAQDATNTIKGTLLLTGTGVTSQAIFTSFSLTVAGRVDMGEGSHANPGGVKVTVATTVRPKVRVDLGTGTLIGTEGKFTLGILVGRQNWPKTSVT